MSEDENYAGYGDEGDYIEGEYDEDAIQPIASIPKVIPEASHIASDEVLGIQTRFFVLRPKDLLLKCVVFPPCANHLCLRVFTAVFCVLLLLTTVLTLLLSTLKDSWIVLS